MLWVLPGALGIFVAESLKLDAAQKGLLVAVPILSGSLLRIPLGIATGVVGAIGGVGGFFLPTLLGNLKQSFGSFASGFVVLACIALAAALALRMLVAIQHGWKFSAERASSRCITTTGGAC